MQSSAKPKIPRKPATKRAKKENPSKGDDTTLPSPPPSPKMAETENDVKKTGPPRTGRQRTGAYSREEVGFIQDWITKRVSEDWETIATETGKATGIYRHKDNLKTLYGTVVLRQVREAFADKNGDGGSVTAADVSVDSNAEKVCGACGARQIEATKDPESTAGGEVPQGREEPKQEGEAPQEGEGIRQQGEVPQEREEKQEGKTEVGRQCQEHISPPIGEEY